MKKIFKSIVLTSLMLGTAIVGFGGATAQAVSYTASDVASHNIASNCWVIINSNVYNLTNFISAHPGGSAAITSVCGANGTASFNSGPHSASTLAALSPYLLGSLTVASPVLTSVTMVNQTVLVGGTVTFTGTPKNQNGGTFVGATTTYSSSNTGIATINSTTGVATGVALGTATITATSVSGSVTVTKTATITVVETLPSIVLTSVRLTQPGHTLAVGKTATLAATPKDQNGVNFVGATTTFSSSNTAVATINSTTGVITAVAVGTTTITATSVSGNTTVTATRIVKVVAGKNNRIHVRDNNKENDNGENEADEASEHMNNQNENHGHQNNLIVHAQKISEQNDD